MFQQVEKFVNTDGTADVRSMVFRAMEYGTPACNHKAWGSIFNETVEWLEKCFAEGRQRVSYDWRFDVGAYGSYVFKADGTIDGIYSFL